MARNFKEERWSVYKKPDGSISAVELYGTVRVTDADGDSVANAFQLADPWSNVPANVKQAISDAWDAYFTWLQSRRASHEV